MSARPRSQIVRTAGADLARDTQAEKAALSAALKQDELPDLADLVLGRIPGRRSERDITLFLNYMGLGYQFAVTGHRHLATRAGARNRPHARYRLVHQRGAVLSIDRGCRTEAGRERRFRA